MSQISANTCNIITIFPLGGDCNSTNASTNESYDGSVDLLVSGGTSPYTITWNNGAQGSTLNNLQTGTYTATTIDYYGDFTATTVCEVGYDTYFLDVFESCSNSGTYVFYSSQTPSIFVQNSIYGLIGQSDCYTYTGRTLYTSQTVQTGFAQISAGPFINCVSCLPTTPVAPVFTQYICLTKNGSPFEQYTFQTGSTVNGYPSYTETGSTTYGMFYSSSNQRWEMSGWTTGVPAQIGSMVQAFNSTTPQGLWSQLGTVVNWTVVTGSCSGQVVSLTLNTNNPTCAANSDGSILINASGGLGPYTYSLDGINYQISALFSSLAAGSGVAYAKDSNGVVASVPYVLVNSSTSQTYVISVNPNFSTPLNTNTVSIKSVGYSINVNPSLSAGETISFTITIIDNKSLKTNGVQTPTIVSSISTPVVSSGTIGSPSSSTTTTGPTARACGGQESSTATTTTYNVTLSGTGYVSGTITSTATTPVSTVASCPTFASAVNQVSISNVSLSTPLCNDVNTGTLPIGLNNTKTGTVSTGSTSKSWNIIECGGTCSGGFCACSTQTSKTVYTINSVTNLTGPSVEIYENAGLTNPYTADFLSGGSIWNSTGSGVTLVCNVGGPC